MTTAQIAKYKDMAEDQQLSTFDALLGTALTDIRAVADYATYPTGTYLFTITKCEVSRAKPGEDAKESYISLQAELVGMIELGNAADADKVPPSGSLYSERFTFIYDGVENFNKVFGEVGMAVGADTVAKLIEALPGMNLACTVRSRKDKQDATKVYNNLKSAKLVG